VRVLSLHHLRCPRNVLLYIGYKVFDLVTPTDMQKKIFEEGNTAVAITVGAFIIGLAIVILGAIRG
jgi:uncharacterized membrane protein YjfL (UPF0719 family)